MTIGTALCFILSGIYMVIYLKSNVSNTKRSLFIIAILIAILSGMFIFENLFNVGLGKDLVSVHQKLQSSGRPVLNTVIGFFSFSMVALSLAHLLGNKKSSSLIALSLLLSIW